MLLYIEYGILFINTVDTKIKAHNAMLLCIEYGILFVNTVDTKIKACDALNAMFVETVNTRFIQYLKCSTQNRENVCVSNSTSSILDEPSCQHSRYKGSSGIQNVLLKTCRYDNVCVSNSTASILDEKSMSSNYSKIQFKALIYF